jgi:hypothetical protein
MNGLALPERLERAVNTRNVTEFRHCLLDAPLHWTPNSEALLDAGIG